MWFTPRFRFARTRPARRPPSPPRRGPALAVEPLEDRVVPAGWFGPPAILETEVVNGTLFFSVAGPEGGQLWRSDGTADGTVLLRTFYGSPLLADAVFPPTNLTAVGGTLFFSAADEKAGEELWKSDGTPAGTVLVKDIAPGPDFPPWVFGFPLGSSPSDLTAVGDTLYFTAFHPDTGREVWRSDGTEKGTVLVRDVNPGAAGSDARNYTLSGGTLFFAAATAEFGFELWRTDGTGDGTALVADVNPGPSSSLAPGEVVFLADVNGVLLFNPLTPEYGRELWRSDGTAEGTSLVADVNPGGASSFPLTSTPRALALGGALFFGADDGVSGRELWVSDGTAEGTRLFADVNPGPAGSDPRALTFVRDRLFFAATHPEYGDELWVSDFTPDGTGLLRDVNPGAKSSSPFFLTAAGGSLFFRAFSPEFGEELWTSDGTAAGTALVRDITPGGASTLLGRLTAADAGLYFVVDDPFSSQLWLSDGTEAGTRLVRKFSSFVDPGDS